MHCRQMLLIRFVSMRQLNVRTNLLRSYRKETLLVQNDHPSHEIKNGEEKISDVINFDLWIESLNVVKHPNSVFHFQQNIETCFTMENIYFHQPINLLQKKEVAYLQFSAFFVFIVFVFAHHCFPLKCMFSICRCSALKLWRRNGFYKVPVECLQSFCSLNSRN